MTKLTDEEVQDLIREGTEVLREIDALDLDNRQDIMTDEEVQDLLQKLRLRLGLC